LRCGGQILACLPVVAPPAIANKRPSQGENLKVHTTSATETVMAKVQPSPRSPLLMGKIPEHMVSATNKTENARVTRETTYSDE